MIRGSKDEFLALCRQFPPRPIGSARQLRLTQAVVNRLLNKAPRFSRTKREYLHVLGTLIHEYEERTTPLQPLDPVELLRELMQERSLRQKDLLPVFQTESIASAVLHGKRQLHKRHIQALARFFRVSPAAFLAEPAAASEAA